MRVVFFLLLLSIKTLAQEEFVLKDASCDNFLYFLSGQNDLVGMVREIYRAREIDTSFSKYYIRVFSNKDGSILKEVSLSKHEEQVPRAFNVSHDGLKFVVLTSPNFLKGPFLIKQYSLNEDRWVWEKEWYSEVPALRLTYSEDNNRIIGVSTKSTIIIDAETGSLIKSSSSVGSINGNGFGHYDLSKNGRYFAFWRPKFLMFSKDDESGILRLIDVSWYGLRWLYHMGSIPNYLYIWDVYRDTLHYKIPIPYESKTGIQVFTEDEKEVVIGPFEGKYLIYLLSEKNLTREFIEKESVSPKEKRGYANDFKIVSPDNNYLAACFDIFDILLIDYNDGHLINKFRQTAGSHPPDRYAMAFSPDSQYFAVVTEQDKINLYRTKTWEKIWGVDLSEK